MDKGLIAALATVAAGGLVALQAPINSMLGKSVGTFAAASVNFVVGTSLLVLITTLFTSGWDSSRCRSRRRACSECCYS